MSHTFCGTRHAISAGHYLATQAGFKLLEAGGNAVDAGVAAGITLAVVQSDRVNFGGVAPQMIYIAAERRVYCIDGVGGWPSAASPDFFLRRFGGKIPLGVHRSVIPAAPSAWIASLSRFGTMSFSDVAAEAIRLAREGFVMYPLMSGFIRDNLANYLRWESTRTIYLPEDVPPLVGRKFMQADLAATLQYMCDEEASAAAKGRLIALEAARNAFYKGDIAAAIVRFHAKNEGLVQETDLAQYRSRFESPVKTTFQGTEVHACGPWSQGPVVPMVLNILRGLDLKGMGHNSVEYVHTVIEALKLAFADRHQYFGDPEFVPVPMDALLSNEYGQFQQCRINAEKAAQEMPCPADPQTFKLLERQWMPKPAADSAPVPGDTTYLCCVDSEGNGFSATPSDGTATSPIVPGLGIVCSARGLASWADPTHPSGVAPGKRPRLTPNPAIATRNGELLMPFGSPGGDIQPQAMLQFFLNVEVFGMSIQDAVEAPRFATYSYPTTFEPHAYFPRRLYLEGAHTSNIAVGLSSKGHELHHWPPLTPTAGAVCAIRVDRDEKTLHAGADPRRPCSAMIV